MLFVGGYTQSEIAVRLGLSPAKVHRLIAQAQRTGLIRFQIDGRPHTCLEYEENLVKHFSLRHCIVAPDLGDPAPRRDDALSLVAGRTLYDLLSAAHTRQVGVGKGRTLKAAIAAMPRLTSPELSIVSVSGSLTPKLSANPYDVVHMLIDRTGGEGYFLPAPYIAANPDERAAFLQQKSVQELLKKARNSDLFVIGIGSLDDRGHVLETGMITAAERRRLRAGVITDLVVDEALAREMTCALSARKEKIG